MAIYHLRVISGAFMSFDETDNSTLTFPNTFKLKTFKYDKFSRGGLINQRPTVLIALKPILMFCVTNDDITATTYYWHLAI